jgi:UDP-N-acetylmuramoyl-tripeptide--D-alanyl-D-alanine ligase
VRAMASRAAGRVLTFGVRTKADVRIADLTLDDQARATFTVHTPWGAHEVRLGVAGRHMAANAAAALACVGVVGGDVGAGAAALSTVSLSSMRMAVHRTPTGAIVIDDSYNANPTSMRAAIDALVDLPGKRKIAVLGMMAEIADAEDEHRALAEYVHGHGIELMAVGTALYGVAPVADPIAALGSLAGGEAVLVKGSRVVGLDRVAAALLLDERVDASDVAPPAEE